MTDTPDDLVKRLRGVHHAMLDWAEDFRRVGSVDGEMSERSRAELLKAAASRIEALESRQRVLLDSLRELYICAREADNRIAWESAGFGNTFAERFEAAVYAASAALAGDAP